MKTADGRSRRQRRELLETLAARCRLSNIGLHRVDRPRQAVGQIAALVRDCSAEGEGDRQVVMWRHPLLEKLDLAGNLPGEGTGVTLITAAASPGAHGTPVENQRRARFCRQLASAGMGITSADYCLADTATLVLKTHPGRPRAFSVVPSVHIAVITIADILADLPELYALLGEALRNGSQAITNCMTLISGPSTTRDIEAIPVTGAQGPREVHIVVLSGDLD